MNKFKIGDVAYHKAGNKLLGTVFAVKDNQVSIRRVDTLVEVDMFSEELKTQDEIKQEHSEDMAILNSKNRNWGL